MAIRFQKEVILSAIATLYLIDQPSTSGLQESIAAGPETASAFFAAHMQAISTFDGSGWIFPTLLPVLDQQYGIKLISDFPNIVGILDIIFTVEHRNAHLDRLDPNLFEVDALRTAFERFNETTEPDAGLFIREGVSFLHKGLRMVTPKNLVLLTVS